jgi:hypothetical protein
MGNNTIPMTIPIVITVEEKTSLISVFTIDNTSQISMQMPDIKASRDKNKSQRMDEFRVK